MVNRMDDIKQMVNIFKPNMMTITEANITKFTHLPSIQIEGFCTEMDEIRELGKRSQVVVYISKELSYKRRKDLETPQIAVVWIELTTIKKKRILTCHGYREWNDQAAIDQNGKNIEEQKQRLTMMMSGWEKAVAENKLLIVQGDWNVDMTMMSENEQQQTSHNKFTKPLYEMMTNSAEDLNLTLLTTQASRFQGNDKPSALDIILTNQPNRISEPQYHPTRSDHLAITFTTDSPAPKPQQVVRETRNYKNYSQEKCWELAKMYNTTMILRTEDPDYATKELTGMIIQILNKLAPMKKTVSRQNPTPHITTHTRQLMKNRDNQKGKALKSKKPEDMKEYRTMRNRIVNQIRKDKRNWLKESCKGNLTSNKDLWRAVSKVTGKNEDREIRELRHKGVATTNSKEMAEIFNTYFKDKLTKIREGLQQPTTPYVETLRNTPVTNPILHFKEVNMTTMDTYIKELKNSGANGYDTIPAFVIKDIYKIWNCEILHITNLSLCTGIFPKMLKITKILPSLKKGKDPCEPSSYRPISSLTMLGKLVERSGYDQLQQHLEKHKIITKNQHGGRKHHSTTTCLLEIQEAYQKAKSQGQKTAILGIDLSSAYDLCSHEVIDQQLKIAGASFLVRKWSLSFLSQRNQVCEVNSKQSNLINSLNMGLCQGGRSSGTLFTLHTNGITSAINNTTATTNNNSNQQNAQGDEQQVLVTTEQDSNQASNTTSAKSTTTTRKTRKRKNQKPLTTTIIKLFVDDTTALMAAQNNAQLKILIQTTFNNIESHLIDLGMAINQSKTQLTIMNPNKEGREITLEAGNQTITHQESLTVLGFQFSETGKMDNQIWKGTNNIIRSIRTKASMLRVIKPYTTTNQLALIANATVNSTILYVAPLWAQTGDNNIQRIQAAQTRIARLIFWKQRKRRTELEHRQVLFERLGWLNTTQLCNQATIQIVVKAINNKSSEEINHMFSWNNNGQKREQHNFLATTENTTKRKGPNLLDRGRDLFNRLPLDLRNNSLKPIKLKKELKSYILDNNQLTRH